jgi:hypothetical protein
MFYGSKALMQLTAGIFANFTKGRCSMLTGIRILYVFRHVRHGKDYELAFVFSLEPGRSDNFLHSVLFPETVLVA